MKNYDLEDRTKEFSKKVIRFCQKININSINKRLIDQLIRSATSIGANYREANEAGTKKDFKNKILIAKKEAKETIYWIELILETNEDNKKEIFNLLDESKQLIKILASIYDKVCI